MDVQRQRVGLRDVVPATVQRLHASLLERLNAIARPLGWEFLDVDVEQRADDFYSTSVLVSYRFRLRCPCGDVVAAVYWRRATVTPLWIAEAICDALLTREHIEQDVAAGKLPAAALEPYERAS